MVMKSKLKENWLLKKVPRGTFIKTIALIFLQFIGTNFYLHDFFNAHSWMPASGVAILRRHEYWRLWTTLFTHADANHILSNMVLFFPFAYFLIGFFGSVFFPLVGFLIGGLTNLIVLKTLPENAHLVGVSGVVYWMGAAWITLVTLINRHEKKSKRILKAIGVSVILFIPETYQPEVSYLTHFIGYIGGMISGLIYYQIKKNEFKSAEKHEWYLEEDFSEDGVLH